MRLREYSHGRDFLKITQVVLFCRLFSPPMNPLPARAAKIEKNFWKPIHMSACALTYQDKVSALCTEKYCWYSVGKGCNPARSIVLRLQKAQYRAHLSAGYGEEHREAQYQPIRLCTLQAIT
jgi:hypothetical protein